MASSRKQKNYLECFKTNLEAISKQFEKSFQKWSVGKFGKGEELKCW